VYPGDDTEPPVGLAGDAEVVTEELLADAGWVPDRGACEVADVEGVERVEGVGNWVVAAGDVPGEAMVVRGLEEVAWGTAEGNGL
jgi:hypothetical protein